LVLSALDVMKNGNFDSICDPSFGAIPTLGTASQSLNSLSGQTPRRLRLAAL
jgi:hypothetical protein